MRPSLNFMNPARSFLVSVAVVATFAGCRIEKPATVVPAPPSIESFTASSPRGGAVTLSWQTSNATSIELREVSTGTLNVAVDQVDGTHQATLAGPALFVLVARGAGGSDARAVSVSLDGQQLGEVSFTALPPVIPGGASTTLAWTAPGATAVTLVAGGQAIDIGGQRTSGAVTVSPKFDTSYTLTADGVARTLTVIVQAALLTAEVSPRAAEVGETVTLSWTAAGADSVTVTSPGRGPLFATTTAAQIEAGTFADVVPLTPDNGVVSYEIAAIKGTTRFTRVLEVNVGTGLAITRYNPSPVAAAGANYTVQWETRAADQIEVKVDGVSVHLTANRRLAAVGLYSFAAPATDFSVELVASNNRGARISRSVQVDASVGVPTSATLTANPTTVAVGQPVTLSFAAAEARRVRITDSSGVVVFSLTGSGAQAGDAVVYPSGTTTYTLSADNLLGSPAVTAQASVTVTGATPMVTQFPPTALSGQNVSLRSDAGAVLYGFPHNQVLTSSQADFRDISVTGARVLEAGSNITSVEVPFATFLWGQRRTGPLTISRAGWMAWGAPLVVNSVNPSTLPSISGASGLIAPFWDDLTLRANSAVYVEVVGSAPDQSIVVQWDKLQVGTDAASDVTFQARVHQHGMVSFHYRGMTYAASASFVVGVQDETRQLGFKATPAANSALYFFSPVAAPAEVRVIKGSTWGGFVKVGSVWSLISQPAGAFSIPADLALTELQFRTHAAVPNGQYLEVVNRTQGPLDLSGWELRAPDAPTYFVPPGFVLQPGVPMVIGASDDRAQNDDAGVTLSWATSGFFLSQDAGSFAIGTADAGAGFNYTGAADGGRGQGLNIDPGPFLGTSGPPTLQVCAATTPYGGQTPPQLGTPGSDPGCGFGYVLTSIAPKFVDISDGGTSLVRSTSAVDGLTVPITLAATGTDPAPVAFGVRRPVVSMSLDGWMVWGTSTDVDYSNPLTGPSPSDAPAGKLAVFWDDMQTTPAAMPGSEMYWKRFAAGEDPGTPVEHWVFQWAHLRSFASSPADDLNYEVKLFLDGSIEYHYGEMRSATAANVGDGFSASVWLENVAGDTALLIGANQPVIRPNTAFRFVPR